MQTKKIVNYLVNNRKFKEVNRTKEGNIILERKGIMLVGSGMELINSKIIVNGKYIKYLKESNTDTEVKIYVQFFRGIIETENELKTIINIMHR